MSHIAVIGVSGRFPGAQNVDEFWKNLCEGRETIRFFTRQELLDLGVAEGTIDQPEYIKAAPVLKDIEQFDASFFGYNRREAEFLDPQQRLFLETAWETLEKAGYAKDDFDGSIGIYAGSGGAVSSYLLNCLDVHPELRGSTGSYQHLGNDKDFVCTRASYELNLRGPSVNVQTACSTSLVAVHIACQSILNGECDMALAGGVSVRVPHSVGYVRQEGDIFSEDGHCRPFDANATGIVFGSGLGLVLLKPLEAALKDRDLIYAVIRGTAINNDGGKKVSYTASALKGQSQCMREALAVADVEPESVSFIEAHGTGTVMGDQIEIQALNEVFPRKNEKYCRLGSVKSNVGHLDVAAGITGLIKTILSLHHKQIPPTINLRTLNPKLNLTNSPFEIHTSLKEWSSPANAPRRAAVNGLGMGGTNAFVVLEEAPAQKEFAEDASRDGHSVICLSAKTEKALRESALNLKNRIANLKPSQFQDLCYTANMRKPFFDARLAIVARDLKDAAKKLGEYSETGKESAGLVCGKSKQDGSFKSAFLFTGQGSQYARMGEELYRCEPFFKKMLDECDKIYKSLTKQSIVSILFDQNPAQLNHTRFTQPAIFSLDFALASLWKHLGVNPSVVLGHSVGEISAACYAGLMSLEDGIKLIVGRAELMGALATKGGMAAVLAPKDYVEKAIAKSNGDVCVAAYNGPTNTVISGFSESLDAVIDQIAKDGHKVVRLETSHAFHSAQLDPMMDQFRNILAKIKFTEPSVKIVSNLTGESAGLKVMGTPEYWTRQARLPVQFVNCVQTLAAEGVNVFVETGPGSTLSSLVRANLTESKAMIVQSLKAGRDSQQQFLESVGRVFAHGVPVQWQHLIPKSEQRRALELPTYPFQRERFWIEGKARATHMPTGQAVSAAKHPLLGVRVELAGDQNQIVYQSSVTEQSPCAFIKDHVIHDTVIVPAAAMIEMAFSAGVENFKTFPIVIDDMMVEQPLVLSAKARTVQFVLSLDSETSGSFQIFSRPEAQGSESAWIRHAAGKLSSAEIEKPLLPEESVEQVRARCGKSTTMSDYYKVFAQAGAKLGKYFRGITSLTYQERECLGALELDPSLHEEARAFTIHPAILDASVVIGGRIFMTFNEEKQHGKVYLPVAFRKAVLHRPGDTKLWGHVRTSAGGTPSDKSIRNEIRVMTANGDLVAEFAEWTYLDAPADSLRRTIRGQQQSDVECLFDVRWKEATLTASPPDRLTGRWIVLEDQSGFGKIVAERIRARGGTVESNVEIQNLSFGEGPTNIVCAWALDCTTMESVADLEKNHRSTYEAPLNLIKNLLSKGGTENVRVAFVTEGAQHLKEHKGVGIHPAQASLWGWTRVLAMEHPDLFTFRIDLAGKLERDADCVINELATAGNQEDQVAYREGKRFVARLANTPMASLNSQISIRGDGAYLITGGFGGLGLSVAKEAVARGARTIALLGRRPPSDFARNAIVEMEKAGAKVLALTGDVARELDVRRALTQIQALNVPLKGIVHAAGSLSDASILAQDWAKFQSIFESKIAGTWNLHHQTRDSKLDFFVMFSSATSLIGNRGQANYAAANAFMDAFAHFRRTHGLPALAINWGPWREIGMLEQSAGAQKQLTEAGMQGLRTADGMDILFKLVGTDYAQIGVIL